MITRPEAVAQLEQLEAELASLSEMQRLNWSPTREKADSLIQKMRQIIRAHDVVTKFPDVYQALSVIDSGTLCTPFLVWPWELAPEALKALSCAGGDEDWVMLVPPGHDNIPWAEAGTTFGCCDVDKYELPNGMVVWIGAHA